MSLRLPRKRAYAVVIALVGLLIGLVGIAPSQASVTNNKNAVTWNVLVGEQTPDLAIQGMRFLPGEIWIDQGDAIKFWANSAEIHTVSFGTPPLPPTSVDNLLADAATPVGGPVFDPTAPWTNSGILTTMPSPDFPSSTSYLQKFAARGDFTFYCLIHGAMMSIVIHVQAPGAPYPHTQAFYNAQAASESAAIIADGQALWDATKLKATATHVYVGASDDTAMVMRFIWPNVQVPVGSTVLFDLSQNQVFVPHTVTFSNLPVDSGLLLPPLPGVPPTIPSTFSHTFNQVGTWNYFCQFHDDMGMVGSVTVS